MSRRLMPITFAVLLLMWLGGVLTGTGGLLVHVLLILAVLQLAAGILRSRRA